ncbi:rRNA methyltransferase 1, mitochondrial isoform X2 [Polypterus senegalus]|uniref:rRNA methyltransferase 1, mitochondrial isoform X2 n=1 Tax=Polypterus senegalus TaxID=55291 RepID=UPI001962DDCD|nr:rRNA methyltransferase 1, mitochondrial isoform X2 [Polypterus senegalus]
MLLSCLRTRICSMTTGLLSGYCRYRCGGMRLVGNANLRRASSRIEVLFGVAPCFIALSRGRRVCHALYTKESRVQQRPGSQELPRRAAELGVPVRRVSKRELDKLSGGRVHQGYCLEVSPLKFTPLDLRTAEEEAHSDGCRLWLLLDRVQDPMNLGAILRSAYYFGLDRVVVGLHDSCPLSPVVSKASAGAMEDLDVYASETLPELIKVKIGQGWHVVGTVGSASEKISVPVIPCSEFQYSQPTVLILGDEPFREVQGTLTYLPTMQEDTIQTLLGPVALSPGNEASGLSPQIQQLCHSFLTIPPGQRRLHPGIDSLNVSVSAGILLHVLVSSMKMHQCCPSHIGSESDP